MIKVLAIDDEPFALQQLVAYINKTPYLQLVAPCRSAIEARNIMTHETIDALFCDINMPDLNGMDFIRQMDSAPLVVFTTAYSEYAIDGFKVAAVDYLLKPFSLRDFQRAAQRVKERIELIQAGNAALSSDEISPDIFIKADHRTIRVSPSTIRYIEGMSEYIKIHLITQPKPLITLMALKRIETSLPSTFMRIHRSFIVNLNYVNEVEKRQIVLSDGIRLPIGDFSRPQLQEWVATHLSLSGKK